MQLLGFQYNPILKGLLANYCLRQYEDNAIIDDEHLLVEYNWLLNNNQLHVLFDSEYLDNQYKDN